ncbi:glycoside hydrolase superfamily [Paraphoma chrysanthemicola]|uniref:glucan 1,3-beta-glucosidase n=1 Tax=Paraphoma chrysanthemicola TaxID=798071 RepID=A0A8K0VZQ7_9PLEO|nr:glycoside hydrolase superfamily [Paraphoma chrysanthemicola]
MFATLRQSTSILALLSSITTTLAVPTSDHQQSKYLDWSTAKFTGVNLGGWFAQEAFIDPYFWSTNCGTLPDEWTCCLALGSKCGPVLEHRYSTFITRRDIDKLASAGVNLLRIPTSYAAWAKIPGSALYSGNQQEVFKHISEYAIKKYGMHVVLDIHSLPGGINGVDIGEAKGHYDWFNNATNLAYSLDVVSSALQFIQSSCSPQSYTLAPINEPVDNRDPSTFGQTIALSENGANWVQKYFEAVIKKRDQVNPKIPLMLQTSFKGAAYWSNRLQSFTKRNLILDVHQYYFAGRPVTSANVSSLICSDAKAVAANSSFPVFVGEWAIQTVSGNAFVDRRKNLNTGLYAWKKYVQGSAYWTARMSGNVSVVGEGVQGDYWNFEGFVDMGYVHEDEGRKYCD